MKKPYIKPTVNKIGVDSDIIRMFTRQGFIDLFWERLQAARKADTAATQKAVFDSLNDHWFNVMGYFRYSDYNSFRQRLSKT
jgi:hypothetical protein